MNNKTRIVKRTYYSRKQGKYITKTYEYKRDKAKKSLLLIGKHGKIYKERLDNFLSNLSEMDKYEALVHIDYAKDKNMQLSERKLKAMLSDNKIDRMLINLGRSAEDLATEIGVSAEDIYNEKNWKGGQFISGDNAYEVDFTYTGTIFKKVK